MDAEEAWPFALSGIPPQFTAPQFLMHELEVSADGVGPGFGCSPDLQGKLIVVTLGITRIVEQQGVIVSIWGSADNLDWGSKPLASFPQKYYCGTSSVLMNLAMHKDVRYLHVRWQMKRWARREAAGMCTFHVSAEESGTRLRTRVAAAAAGRSSVLPELSPVRESLVPEIT